MLSLAPFGKALALDASLNEVFASTVQPELLTTGLDLEGLSLGPEAEASCRAVVHELNVRVLEFDHLATIDTHEVVVCRAFDKIGIIGFLVVPQIDLMKQACFDQ